MAKEYEVTTGKRIVSRMMGTCARLGIGNFVILTTTGRETGQPRTVTLAPISDPDGQYLVSPYGNSAWVRNVRKTPHAVLQRGGSRRAVRLVEVTGQKANLVKGYYEREAFARQFMDVPGDGTVEDFATVPDRFPVFRVDDEA